MSSSADSSADDELNIPFSQRVAQRQDGRGGYDPEAARAAVQANAQRGRREKRSKNKTPGGPAVLSTQVRVSRARVVVGGPPQVKRRDPRFDGLAGKVDHGLFDHHYGFVRDLLVQECAALEAQLADPAQTLDEAARDNLHAQLRHKRQRLRTIDQQQSEHELGVRVKAKKRKMREEAGGRPVRMARKDVKKIELEERYHMLEETNQVEGYLSRKRKKNQQRNKKVRAPARACVCVWFVFPLFTLATPGHPRELARRRMSTPPTPSRASGRATG